jgi:anti-sigma B factor antagonist
MSVCNEGNQAGVATDGGSADGCRTAVPPFGAAGHVPDFSLALGRDGSGTAVLALTGELDLYRAPEVENALAEATGREAHRSEEVRRLTVDIRSVTFIDSTMLALLLAASRRQQERGTELRVLVGPRTPMTAFEVTGIDRLLAISRDDDGPNGSVA